MKSRSVISALVPIGYLVAVAGLGCVSATMIGCGGDNSTPIGGTAGSGGSGGSGGSTATTTGGGGSAGSSSFVQDSGSTPIVEMDSTAGTGGTNAGADSGSATDDAAADAAKGDSGTTATDPGTEGDGIVMIAQPFKAAPEMTAKPGVATGKTIQFQMPNSKTFGDGGRAAAV